MGREHFARYKPRLSHAKEFADGGRAEVVERGGGLAWGRGGGSEAGGAWGVDGRGRNAKIPLTDRLHQKRSLLNCQFNFSVRMGRGL